MSTATATSPVNPNDASTAVGASSTSILTDKVARAVQVRTDTVAMKAALDALQDLDTTRTTGTTNSRTASTANTNTTTAPPSWTDPRSVRTAMERDALQQARQLRDALGVMCANVSSLTQECGRVAATAAAVREALHGSVVTDDVRDASASLLMPTTTTSTLQNEEKTSDDAENDNQDSQTNALQREYQLASALQEAFRHRQVARQRYEAVDAFLETFDLRPADSELLANYNFEDITVSVSNSLEYDNNTSAQYEQGLAFLSALERVRTIRQALNQTFGGGSGSNAHLFTDNNRSNNRGGLGAPSALRMMESLSLKQERAYERLYRWLQTHLQLFPTSNNDNNHNANDTMDDDDRRDEALVSSFVPTAVHTLRHVPAFYSHTLELIAASRRATVTRRFLYALTAGSSDGTVPPLELKAHDAVAYVGDMLAFAFRSFSVEADLAKGLLHFTPLSASSAGEGDAEDSTESSGDHNNDLVDDNNDGDGMERTEQAITAPVLLSVSVSGLARPLKARIVQVVGTLARRDEEDMDGESDDGADDFDEEGAVLRTRLTHLYEIIGLLLFYASTMEATVEKLSTAVPDDDTAKENDTTKPNPLVECLTECLTEATTAYEATIRVYGAMLDQLSVMTGESEASLVQQMLELIAQVRLSSPGFSIDVPCPEHCRRILSIDWVTETLVETSVAKCETLDDAVALQHSLTAAKKAGMDVVAAEQLDAAIEDKKTQLIEALVDTETTQVLELCGLWSIANAWKLWKDVQAGDQSMAMASYPGLSKNDMENAMTEFYGSLYSPPLPSLEATVKDPQARKMARSRIADNVCDKYTDLYESAVAPDSGYGDMSFLAHTPAQVGTLFSA